MPTGIGCVGGAVAPGIVMREAFGVFWISGIAVVGTFVIVILVYWLLLAG